MSEANQLKVLTVIFVLVMGALFSFVTYRDHVGLERSLHCATCSP